MPLAAAVVAVLGWSAPARANPKPLPFSYTYPTLGEGEAEIEQLVDGTPVKAISAGSGAQQWSLATQFQTEIEYGVTNKLEVAFYLTLAPEPGDLTSRGALPESNGVKQRVRYRFAEEGQWPIDLGLYGEVTENDREIELEAKILLQRRFRKLTAVVNLWAEREWYFVNERDWVINPTAGLTYEVTPTFHPGVEAWMRAEWPDPAVHPRPFNVGPHELVGPTVLLNFGKIWWSTGVYVRVDETGHRPTPGDAYGSVWARTIVGIGL